MRRFAFLVVALLAVSASSALACNEPSLGSVTPSARAGEPVSFSAVHLDPGASYALVLAGRTVASGTAGEGTIGGSFAMPNLGPAGVYYLELHVAHDGGTWVSSREIQFVAPAPAAPAPKPRAAAPSKQRVLSPPTPTPKATLVPKPKTTTLTQAKLATTSGTPVAATSTAVSRPATEPKPKQRQAHQTAARPNLRPRTLPAPFHAPRELPDLVAGGAPLAAASSAHAAVVREVGNGVLPWLVIAAAALLPLGAAAAAVFVRRRRSQRDAALEAELQEMIAEARAGEGRAPALIDF